MKNEKMLNQEAGNSKGIDASVLGRTPAAENDVNEYTSELQAVNALLKEEIEVRKNAEKALHRSQDEFRFLFDTMVHGVIVQDADSTIIETNDAACEILGLTKDQFLGKTTYDPRWKLIHEDGSPLTPAEMPSNIALRTGKPVVDVLIGAYIPERDTYHWILTSSTPKFRDDEQQPYLTMTTFTNITERKQIEQERQGHLRFFECMDQINRAIQSNNNVEQMMSDVLDQVLSIFDCDRVFLLYPCDPATPTWTVPMERTKPEYPGVGLMGTEVPMDPDVARTIELLLSADGPLQFGPGTPYPLPAEVSKRYGFKSLMSMVLYPKVGSPWQFGIHYCAQEVVSSTEDVRLFREIGRRLSDALMWKGETEMVADSVVQTFAGNRRNVTVYVSVCPGFEKTLSKVLVSLVDITERKLVENALLRSEAILNEAQRIGKLGSWELDLTTDHLRWSDEIYRIFEIDPKKFGASYEAFLDAIHPEDREKVNVAYTNSLSTRSPYSIDHRLHFDDGRIKYVQETCETFYDGEGRPLRSVGIVHDITDRKLAEEEIHLLNRELEHRVVERTTQLEIINKELEAFAYSVSHDLRTPLRSIDGFSQLLLDDYQASLDETGKGHLHRIRAAAQRMAQLIDDLLNLSRISRSGINVKRINLSNIVTEIADTLQATQPDRKVEFMIQKEVTAEGDSQLLRIVLENLIGNAWKFTSRHSTARIEFGVLQLDMPVYFVRDDGAGFDMSYAQKLFGAFQRLHTVVEFQGTGIGLATVQRIIHKHGGRVWAEGKIEQGATVYFTIAP